LLEVKRQIIVLLISLIASSLLATFVPSWVGQSFTKADEVLLAINLFLSFLLVDIAWLLGKIDRQSLGQYQLWQLREPFDAVLSNIRRSSYEITKHSYGQKDIFVAHFMKQLRDLETKITEVADKRLLHVQADHFLSVDNVLDAFLGDAERIWRYTWEITRDDRLFRELAWSQYFEKTARMVMARQINEIRSILMVEDRDVLESPRVKKLLDFFATNDGLSCRIILKNNYQRLCADNCDFMTYEDFGIYGNRLLFLTEQYEPVIIGVFTKDEERIRQYMSLFDMMWTSASVTFDNPSKIIPTVTLEELFAFDSIQF